MIDIEMKLKEGIQKAFLDLGKEIDLKSIVIEHSKDKSHGDYATNVAMQFCKLFQTRPSEVAKLIVSVLNIEEVEKVEIAGPGFINFFLKSDSLIQVMNVVKNLKDHYGESTYGNKEKINVEFVSANPTGDLHLGHARGAAIGDAICRMYEKVGYDVTREYYVNDAGNQIHNLALSLRARYHQAFGENDYELPENGYHGPDIAEIASIMKEEVGDKYLTDNEEAYEYFKTRGTELELAKLCKDLNMFRVTHNVFSSELKIRKEGAIEKVLETLKPYIYQDQGATFLKTSEFSDDKDRVIIKSDGSYTYLLPDIAYHWDKLKRGYSKIIDCLGADHHGYIERMKSSFAMLGYNPSILDIELIQMVRLFKDGKEYKMSKRTGNAVSMKELCEEVGVDAVRYFFVARAASSHLDFDLDLAAKMESSNPVFYAQYAHARLSKVLELGSDIELNYQGTGLEKEKEIKLLKLISEFPKELLSAALTRAPYKVTIYIQKLATAIHEFYADCKVLDRENIELTASRLALCATAKQVLKNALETIGVSAPERM